MSPTKPYAVRYSTKSVAVLGKTFPIKDELHTLGGKYNRNLRYLGNKTPGWIFGLSKAPTVQLFLDKVSNLYPDPELSDSNLTDGDEGTTPSTPVASSKSEYAEEIQPTVDTATPVTACTAENKV